LMVHPVRVSKKKLRSLSLLKKLDPLKRSEHISYSNGVHPDRYQKENTLIDWILRNYPEIREVGEAGRQGLVHRLDKDVSGLMVVARNNAAYQCLVGQFKSHKVKKEYLALVFGTISPSKGVINFSIARNKKGKLVAIDSSFELSRQKVKNIKSAITEYEIINKFQEFTLLRLKLLTGRTHQIRLHLKAMGCPIVGDKKYSTKQFNNLTNKQGIDRIFLHACCLGFYDLQNKWQEFKGELPDELKAFLKTI
ncbi:RNA pseudouridine synthase, partial [bacterium]|nr:RNA pseudouridine synthase [bacterium]